MSERSDMMEAIRAEIVGPARLAAEPESAQFTGKEFSDPVRWRTGPLAWRPEAGAAPQEILYYSGETPHRKYGAGLLHPALPPGQARPQEEIAAEKTDTLGVDSTGDEPGDDTGSESHVQDQGAAVGGGGPEEAEGDDMDVTSPDVRHPSTMGISFCVRLGKEGQIIIRLPQSRRFAWQPADSAPFPLNGRYEPGQRNWIDDKNEARKSPVWRRRDAVLPDTDLVFHQSELVHHKRINKDVVMPENSPLRLRVDLFARPRPGVPRQPGEGCWLVTVVLRNVTPVSGMREPKQAVLYQTCFEAAAAGGTLEKYPESQRPFAQLDGEEQSLALLYRESATWAIGHGCAAGWEAEPGETAPPPMVRADVMPAVQLPSMTPDITDAQGGKIVLSMRALASLSDSGEGPAWQSLDNLAAEYGAWIDRQRAEAGRLSDDFSPVAARHLDGLNGGAACLRRINAGIALLRRDERVRRAFRLANLAMLLQQIATKKLRHRPLRWDAAEGRVSADGPTRSPWDVYQSGEDSGVGSWRAFQIAFLLMSLEGICDGSRPDREVVDLIWFPTGGGKTEAYLAVMACYMFHERLLMEEDDAHSPRRDGTNVLMRYTLRMLTTQQFQRAASLICAMEFLRRNPALGGAGVGAASLGERRFSLGLWIGAAGSPNKISTAKAEVNAWRDGKTRGNPLVLTECPWCRAEIGKFDGAVMESSQVGATPVSGRGSRGGKPKALSKRQMDELRLAGISEVLGEGPLLHCTDTRCAFGQEDWRTWLPVEVIDERMYQNPPSLVIGTADKLAMIAYRPDAGALFGNQVAGGQPRQVHTPPGLIIQDELHLISGPLGTMYALYEGIFERLCSSRQGRGWIKPKLIASTATIRGAGDQVRALYGRERTQLFPAPGLHMGDSFFGRYARGADGKLSDGRLYLGLHASNYGSALTTQVRAFSTALFRPHGFAPERRDAWWTLLVFFNSLRELGGARTLFDSDIRSRLKFLFNREGNTLEDRRHLRPVEELTSRLSQSEIVGMMDQLSREYAPDQPRKSLDVCLASSIIEVGVDIDRLSLMGVVGQPKTTAQYIQVTGRVGRKWWERAGLILMIYNPSKSRDRSHFEQFHSYHRRLYERVEPTSATPFALSAIQRALPGALLAWVRQQSEAPVQNQGAYAGAVEAAFQLLRERCGIVQEAPEDQTRSLREMDRVRRELEEKWSQNPQMWQEFPPSVNGEYLMLWPGQFASSRQKDHGVQVPSSLRQVDRSAELEITEGYALESQSTPSTTSI